MASGYLSASTPNGKPASLHDSARGSPEPVCLDGFHQLVDDINQILGPCNGIDSAGVDVEELKNAMHEYCSNEQEWQKYAFADFSRGYTRNLVDKGNGKSNLVSNSYLHLCSRTSGDCLAILASSLLRPTNEMRSSKQIT